MRSVIRLFACLLPILSIVGCSSVTSSSVIQNRDEQYLSAKSIPPLAIPPGISENAFVNDYPVSQRQYPESAKTVSLVPPGLNSN